MRQKINFNRKWAFSKTAEEIPSVFPNHWNLVNLPHTWNNIDGQDGENDYYRGTCYYVKACKKSELPVADAYYLEFCGSNSVTDVYVNGIKTAHHEGGYSTWRANISDVLQEENLIVVTVDNSVNDFVYPQMADFTFYGGIYRDVSVIGVSSSRFDLDYYGGPGIRVTNESIDNNALITVEVFLTNPKPSQHLLITVEDRDGHIVAKHEGSIDTTKISLQISHVRLWDGKNDPYLYTARAFLKEGETICDNISTDFGCRFFYVDPEQGFFLNGRSYPLRGVSRHQDYLDLGNALLPEHHERDIELISELGATAVRLAHYQHDSYFYDLCDRAGLIVWAEIPYISKHMTTGKENTVNQLKELIIQNYNHPSIVVWGLSNEITMTDTEHDDMVRHHKTLNDLVHRLDKTRLTTIACVSMCDIRDPYIQIPDVVSYNHYFGWYGGDTSMNGPWFDRFHEQYPNIPIGISEYGCEALNWHSSSPTQGDYTEEYQAYYHEELIKQISERPYLWSTFVWNMFDFGADARNEGGENGQNHKGLVTFDRKYKKDAFYAYKAWLSSSPFVHLCGKRYIDRVEPVTDVTVYSNQPEVELFVNGQSLGKQRQSNHFFRFKVPNEGFSQLLAVAGDCRDTGTIRKVNTFREEYRLKEKGAILNWFDITSPEGFFSLNDTIDSIRKHPSGHALITAFLGQLTKTMGNKAFGGFEVSESMMQMMGGFTVIRLTGLLGMTGIEITKEQLLRLNQQLNKIEKGNHQTPN